MVKRVFIAYASWFFMDVSKPKSVSVLVVGAGQISAKYAFYASDFLQTSTLLHLVGPGVLPAR